MVFRSPAGDAWTAEGVWGQSVEVLGERMKARGGTGECFLSSTLLVAERGNGEGFVPRAVGCGRRRGTWRAVQSRRATLCYGVQRGGRGAGEGDGHVEDPVVGQMVEEEDLQDDEDYMVVDGKDLDTLLGALIESGRDGMWNEDGVEQTGAEYGASSDRKESREDVPEYSKDYTVEEEQETAESFFKAYQNRDVEGKDIYTSDNMKYLPKWAQDIHRNGLWPDFVKDSEQITGPTTGIGTRSLDHLVDAEDNEVKGEIAGLTIEEIALDYRLTMEIIMEEMFRLGAPMPLRPSDVVGNCLDMDQVKDLINFVTSFDAADLDTRYSDNTIRELALDYDVSTDFLCSICHDEEIYLPLQEQTHLLKTDEAMLTKRVEDMLGITESQEQ